MATPETPNVLNVKLYKPHSGQRLMHDSKARFRIATCGRRFGKTTMCANEIIRNALNKPGSKNLWVAPVFKQTEIGYRQVLKALTGTGLIKLHQKSQGRVILINESRIDFLSASNYDTLRGENWDLVIIDEASMVDEQAWEMALRPTLADTLGRAILVGTPKGRNWFYRMWSYGQDPEYKEYESWHFATSKNPYIPRSEIEDAKLRSPEDVFRQEWLAEFLEDSAGVFRGINKCIIPGGMLNAGIPGRTYVMGWDPAKAQDFSVMCVMDRNSRQLVAFERSQKLDWTFQLMRLHDLAARFKASIIMDTTGVGDPLYEQVRQRGLFVKPYHFTNQSKALLIENLAIMIQQEKVKFPNQPELINELRYYQYTVSEKTRKIIYGAPSGYHDDCVMALCLAAWGCKGKRMFEEMVKSDDILPKPQTTNPQHGWKWDGMTQRPVYPTQRIVAPMTNLAQYSKHYTEIFQRKPL